MGILKAHGVEWKDGRFMGLFSEEKAGGLPSPIEVTYWEAIIQAIAALGSKLMEGQTLDRLFGENRDKISRLVENAVLMMQAFIDMKIDELIKNRIQGQIDFTFINLMEWEKTRDLARLTSALDRSLTAATEAKQWSWKQIDLFGDACSIRVLALCADAKREREPGRIATLRAFVDWAKLTSRELIDKEAAPHYEGFIQRVTPLSTRHCSCLDEPFGHKYICGTKVTFYDNGSEVSQDNITAEVDRRDYGGDEFAWHQAACNACQQKALATMAPERQRRIDDWRKNKGDKLLGLNQRLAIRQANWEKCLAHFP